jgi:hypothetical protein
MTREYVARALEDELSQFMWTDNEVYNGFEIMARKQGRDDIVEFIDDMLEIWIQLDQFWDMVRAEKNKK